MVTLPTLIRRVSRPPSDGVVAAATAKADATSAASPVETPASPVVTKPLSAISRLGASIFHRKASTLTVADTMSSRQQRDVAAERSRPKGRSLRLGSTETRLSSSLPESDLQRLAEQSRALRQSVQAPPTAATPSHTNEGDANQSIVLVPHRPPGEKKHEEEDTFTRRPILSKKMSASDSLTTTRERLSRHSGSHRNLGHFDRSKTMNKPVLVSQGSSHSSRDSNGGTGPPYTPQHVLDHFEGELTVFEKLEITKFSDVYYYASLAIKSQRHSYEPPDSGESVGHSTTEESETATTGNGSLSGQSTRIAPLFNDGFDDERGDYVMLTQDHLGYRYEVLHPLGSGSFGQVVCCLDHLTKAKVAVKVIRNRKKYKEQAMLEIRMLALLQTAAPATKPRRPASKPETSPSASATPDCHHTVQMMDHFHFRNHLCISFELLGMNLYEYLKLRFFQGMPMANIRVVTSQLLDAFKYLRAKHIIHCDLKPENVLIKCPLPCFGAGPGNSSVAYANVPVETVCLIDFGSSCLDSAPIYTYIQSRFYRSPEVILGHPYGTAIDMWSLGCVIVELHTGHPIFAGESETEQLMCMMEILGVPSASYLAKCKRRKIFFQEVLSVNTPPPISELSSTPDLPGASAGQPRLSTVEAYKPLAFINSRGRKRMPSTKDLVALLRTEDADFVQFVRKCFTWDPNDRLTPEEALSEPWVVKQGLAEESKSL